MTLYLPQGLIISHQNCLRGLYRKAGACRLAIMTSCGRLIAPLKDSTLSSWATPLLATSGLLS
eukprot:480926-Pleurochrysis_carterae.AAC.1